MVAEVFLFVFGALGALLIVYIATQQVVPEFRALFDIEKKVEEIERRQVHIISTEKEIDHAQKEYLTPGTPADQVELKKIFVNQSFEENKQSLARVKDLEKDVKHGQIISRSLGFFTYIVLGGVFSVLLAGNIEIAGLTGDASILIQAFVIGATWTSYLSVVGIHGSQKGVEEKFQKLQKQANDEFEELKKELSRTVATKVSDVEKAVAVTNPIVADKFANEVTELIESYKKNIDYRLNNAQQKSQREAKMLL